MLKISRQQILDRWDTLTDNLKQALFSQENANVLWQVCESQHLTEDKILIVATIAGDVILGFLHREDLAKEIQENLSLNPEIANSIAREIDRKIFIPIGGDLKKVYSPVSEVLDLRPKTAEQRLEETVIPAAGGKIETQPAGPSVEGPKIVGVEEKPKEEKGIPSAPAPAAEMPEGPMIIHKQTEFQPLPETKKSLGGLFGFLRKDKEERVGMMMPPAKVSVEFGNEPAGQTPGIGWQQPEKTEVPKIAKTEMPKVRVVHYSEVPTGTSPFPIGAVETPKQESVPIQISIKQESAQLEVKPPETLPVAPEEKPIVNEPATMRSEPILDLRKNMEPTQQTPEKPIAPPMTPPVAPPPITPPPITTSQQSIPPTPQTKPNEEMIDLGMFK